ncbi:hypothetical protein FOXG_12966 [Fusarium oxysporum f. sp. lycopersici 4287]|uniref:Zn(2)-C6 fungal-type domain-containing protein n=3 Tax=Fusarium oxysporum TaxID=5507 RepID=A0A0J9WS11_FUSO4|nr:hypothetical protein FOXG_12966 [Fusarium oxysporum f. sp. lycopersici 4287]EXK38456.1 hypothetical protein FOMG_08847 [Fusarium oxysporum f. sp. melonis 26406]KAJ9416886.1 hypothetical protein QL093DRAFT_2400712 [Fusarium oxysporum]KNB13472.1 hypothetical protein FOXG_12966 [Fusarium oxysporum f. sp. lycopersici 4287]
MPERAQPNQRRAHTKSRRGCIDCKRRRVKCSEEKPDCSSCIRRGLLCIYPASATSSRLESRNISESHSPVPSATTNQCSDLKLVPISGNSLSVATIPDCTSTTTFDMNDLALLHHWTISTSLDIVRCPQVDYCWQTVFPRIASRHPFVMHGILSLAALHLAYRKERTKESILAAIRHHNTSLQGFRDNILHVTNDNSEGLFVSSALNIIYIFGMLGRPSRSDTAEVDSSSPTTRALGSEWIPMIRGVRAVLHRVYDHVRLGPLGPLLELGNWNELDMDRELLPEDEYLYQIQETWALSEQNETYNEVLQVLRRCFLYASQFKMMDKQTLEKWSYNRSWAAPLVFLHWAPDEYFMQLQQRQPPALILFAYFGALLHDLNDFWFLEGWGRDIVQIINEQLGSYWRPWMDRPRQAVGLA